MMTSKDASFCVWVMCDARIQSNVIVQHAQADSGEEWVWAGWGRDYYDLDRVVFLSVIT